VTAVNSLVVGRVEMSTPLAGTFLLEDCDMISSGIKSGDWVEGGMGAFAAVADGVAMVLDPLGSAIGMGIGWLIEHMEPIKGWFNDLTGDAGEVMGFAGTWESIAAQMQSASDELTRVLGDLDSQHGLMVETYRKFQTECAAHAAAAGRLSSAIGTGMQIASTIVQAVHDITRDALSQAIGTAISAAATAAITLGFGAPAAIAQVTARVASLTAKVGKFVTKLLKAIGELMPLLDDAARLFRSLKSAFDDVLTGASDAVRSATRKADDVVPGRKPEVPSQVRGSDASSSGPQVHSGVETPETNASGFAMDASTRGPTLLNDGDVVDMGEYHGITEPPAIPPGSAHFKPEDFETGPGEATFWSGRSVLPNGEELGSGGVASEFAAGSHRTTLENTLLEKGITMPPFDINDSGALKAWEAASHNFAAGAQGNVTVVIGDVVRTKSIWEVTEFPLLQSNPNVTSISSVNAITGAVTRLWP